MNNLKNAALTYCKKDRSIIPIKPGDKKPLIKWERHQRQRAKPEQINDWWEKWPDANVGIVTGGVSGIDVIDIDSPKGLTALNELIHDSITTPVVRTPGGGWHHYHKHSDGLSNAVGFIKDVDFRGDGGYIVAPPSKGQNGRAYAWVEGLSIDQVDPPPLPNAIYNVLINAFNRGDNIIPPDNIGQQTTTCDNIRFDKGYRDNTLFHLANCLVKGGMPLATIEKYLTFFASHCNPPFSQKELNSKIQSAFKRLQNRERNLTQEIRDYILTTSGNFLTTNVYEVTTMTTREDKKKAIVVLGRFVKEGLIERVGNMNGCFRRVERDCDAMDFLNVEIEILDIALPFGINRMVEIMPGNIILIAGEPNAGKTAFFLNVIKSNMHRFEIHYFNSEMGDSELRKRLSMFDMPLGDWKFHAWERVANFADVIKPGKGKINMIDYLEIHDNFYEVGGHIAEIYKKLKGAVAIIALQKNKGVDVGLGGFRSLEKPRLALAMSPGVLKIVKAKNWRTSDNPNGKQINFKIAQGCKLSTTSNWHRA